MTCWFCKEEKAEGADAIYLDTGYFRKALRISPPQGSVAFAG